MPITIGLVDDHQLFLKSLTSLLQSFDKYEVVLEALNGKDMQDKTAPAEKCSKMDTIIQITITLITGG